MSGHKRYNDRDLVVQIKNGNKDALVQLYRDNYMAVRNHILKNSGSPDDVEDVLQDAVIAVWEKIQRNELQLEAKLSTFVFAVARNQWLKKLNKAGRNDKMDEITAANLADPAQQNNMDLSKVKQLVMELGDACRDILTLFYFQEMDMESIARKLNYANADTVKAKKYQCFKKLQENFLAKYKKSDFLGA